MRTIIVCCWAITAAVSAPADYRQKEGTDYVTFSPDAACDRLSALKPSAGLLYIAGYCRYRNALTGRCHVRNELLAARLGIHIAQLSTSKAQLLALTDDAGQPQWLVRDPDQLKWGVIPIMGAREFQARRAWTWRGMKDEDRWAFINSGIKIWNYQTGQLEPPNFQTLSRQKLADLEIPNLTGSTPPGLTMSDLEIPNLSQIDPCYMNHINTSTAAAPDLEIPNLTGSTPPASAPANLCTAEYLERVLQSERYPPELEPAEVRRVFRQFMFDRAEDGQPPTKKFFIGYLKREAEEKLRRGQIALPIGAATMHQAQAKAGVPPGNVRYPLAPEPTCEVCAGSAEYRSPQQGLYCVCRICQCCYGMGQEVVPGYGARRCPHLTDEGAARRAQMG